MVKKALTDGSVAGTGTLSVKSGVLGGVLITTDGTNAAVVVISNNDVSGEQVFDISTKQPLWVSTQVLCEQTVYYSITGTGAAAQIYEHVE